MRFTVIRASEAHELARALTEGQRAAMRPYRIDHIVKAEVFPGATLVAAESDAGILVGGLRVEIRTAAHSLPLEGARQPAPRTAEKLRDRARAGLGEICGLWVSAVAGETDVPARLVRLGIAVAQALALRHLVAFCGHHSLPLAQRCGFRIEPGEPLIPYPDARYRSRIVWRRLPAAGSPHTNRRESP